MGLMYIVVKRAVKPRVVQAVSDLNQKLYCNKLQEKMKIIKNEI